MSNENKKSPNKFSLAAIGFYQMFLSPYFGGNCRFYPSCSCYARQAFQEYPWLQAFAYTLRRLLKCHPLGPHGYDPLPERKSL